VRLISLSESAMSRRGAGVAFLQQRIAQHRAQRRRQRHRQARVHAVALPAVHHLQERQVGFGDGFEQPAFLQKLFVLRMAHERQVRVEDDGKVAGHEGKEEL
jgi:hypothetical protein